MRNFFRAISDGIEALYLLTKVRSSVVIFAIQMESQLKKNDYKGGWSRLAPETLIRMLQEHVDLLSEAYKNDYAVIDTATDLANIAMFAAENQAMKLIQEERDFDTK